MGNCVVGIILQYRLQGVDGVVRLTAADLDFALIDLSILVVGPNFYDLVIQLAGFIELVFQDEQLNVIFLDHQVFGMVLRKNGIFRRGFIELIVGVIEVAQHAVAHGIGGKIFLRLPQEFFSLSGLVLSRKETGQREPGIGILGSSRNRAPE